MEWNFVKYVEKIIMDVVTDTVRTVVTGQNLVLTTSLSIYPSLSLLLQP